MNGMTDKDREPRGASRADGAGPAGMVSQEDRVSQAVMASQEDKASPAATAKADSAHFPTPCFITPTHPFRTIPFHILLFSQKHSPV